MIHRYDFGSPIDTGAIVRQLPVSGGKLPYFAISRCEDALRFSLSLDAADILFGLGEANRGINTRGHLYTSWNTDDGLQTEPKNALSAALKSAQN
jgi:alpha-glucosidase